MDCWKLSGISYGLLETVWSFIWIVGNCLEFQMDCWKILEFQIGCWKMSVNTNG